MIHTADVFRSIGGVFLTPATTIVQNLKNIKAYVFDWDGVFNDGVKSQDRGSAYSEPDSMGLNMLRYNHWRLTGTLPYVAVISGANNPTAIDLAKRENFHAVYLGFAHKIKAFEQFTATYGVGFIEIAFAFDDILDLSSAQQCGLTFCVRREASPLFQAFIQEKQIGNYLTGQVGGNHAVREISELLMGLTGEYSNTIQSRMEFSADYQQYLTTKKEIATQVVIFGEK
jgi:3-deoxy-D-manno-octulosonate 8-phosphate phosphatase (KDO 8-P phosphatase)